MLRSGPIRTPGDGIRMSVMSRHTLNDGTTPDPTITPELFDIWYPELAPPPTLLGDYYKRGLSWAEFEDRYNEHLDLPAIDKALRWLARQAMSLDITVLCTEESPQQCHRRLLVARCKVLLPDLQVSIR